MAAKRQFRSMEDGSRVTTRSPLSTQDTVHGQISAPDAEERGLGFERVVFFSDAVFAIAITLLAIEIHVGEIAEEVVDVELPQHLWAAWPQVLAYLIGFSVIGAYWVSHHRLFSYIKRYDYRLIWLNLLFLSLIAISPFPTNVIGEYGFHQPAQIFYALSVSVTGFAKVLVWWYASHDRRLVDSNLDAHTIRQVTMRGLIVPVVFLLSVPFTWFGPVLPMAIWLATPFAAGAITRRM